MKNIKIALNFLLDKGEPLSKVLTSSIDEGTEKQIEFANSIFKNVIAETQARLNIAFKDYRIDSVEKLEMFYSDHENYPFKSIEMMIEKFASYKKASTVINHFKDNRNIKEVLSASPSLENFFDENNYDY